MISFHRLYHVSCAAFSVKKQGLKLCKMVNPRSKKWDSSSFIRSILSFSIFAFCIMILWCYVFICFNFRQWHPTQPVEEDALPSIKSLTKVKHEAGKRGLRRTAMLNKIFMKQITDLMSTGTVAMNVVGRGIEISKVSSINMMIIYKLKILLTVWKYNFTSNLLVPK